MILLCKLGFTSHYSDQQTGLRAADGHSAKISTLAGYPLPTELVYVPYNQYLHVCILYVQTFFPAPFR